MNDQHGRSDETTIHNVDDDPLVGREVEVELIGTLVDDVASGLSGALLFAGEAGIGKSELLDAAAALAAQRNIAILRASGTELEADIDFAGLHQLLQPLQPRSSALEPVHATALRVALGLGSGDPPELLVVATATSALLSEIAGEHGLVVIVDDLQWFDRISVEVLAFVTRRLGRHRIGFLGSARDEGATRRDLGPQIRVHRLEPLPREAAAELLRRVWPTLAPSVLTRLLDEACGNPLAIRELPAALTPEERSAVVSLPAVLTLSPRLRTIFEKRVRSVPLGTRRALLIAALDGTGDPKLLRQAVGDDVAELMGPAEDIGLVTRTVSDARVRFDSPLIRSAIVEFASVTERRAGHRAIADVLPSDSERGIWHRAEAAAEPDEGVARRLDDLARAARQRGDSAAAVRALTRAATLSPEDSDRGRRLAEAAYHVAHAGELTTALNLLTAARDADPAVTHSLPAAGAAAYALLGGDGDVDTAHQVLVNALAACADPTDAGDEDLLEIANTLFITCLLGGRPRLWTAFHEFVANLRPAPPIGLTLRSTLFADPARASSADLAALDAEIAALSARSDPVLITRTTINATFVGRLPHCREPLWRAVRQATNAGVAIDADALRDLALDSFMGGEWAEAERIAENGLRRLTGGHTISTAQFEWILALLCAARGDLERSHAFSESVLRWSTPLRAFGFGHYAAHARVLAAAAADQWEEAFRNAEIISPAGELASHVGAALWVCMDLVEAAVRTNRTEAAAAHVAALREADVAAISPHAALLSLAAQAMCAPTEEAGALYEAALAVPGGEHWPFDRARVQLSYGTHLRRIRASVRARVHLNASLQTFQWLGAQPWTARALVELRAAGATSATGVKPSKVNGAAIEPLTAQEREIAELAAAGLTNKQIGERLFLSHRTVGNHLHRLFPKLGVTSRAGLRDALADEP